MKRTFSKLTILFLCFAITSTSAMAQKSKKPLPDTTKIPDTTRVPDTTKIPDTSSAKIDILQTQNESVVFAADKPGFSNDNNAYVAIREELENAASQE